MLGDFETLAPPNLGAGGQMQNLLPCIHIAHIVHFHNKKALVAECSRKEERKGFRDYKTRLQNTNLVMDRNRIHIHRTVIRRLIIKPRLTIASLHITHSHLR